MPSKLLIRMTIRTLTISLLNNAIPSNLFSEWGWLSSWWIWRAIYEENCRNMGHWYIQAVNICKCTLTHIIYVKRKKKKSNAVSFIKFFFIFYFYVFFSILLIASFDRDFSGWSQSKLSRWIMYIYIGELLRGWAYVQDHQDGGE